MRTEVRNTCIAVICVFLALALSSCAPKPQTTEFNYNRDAGEFVYINERDCDVLVEFAEKNPEVVAGAADVTSSADLLKAVRKIQTTCGQNKGFQELQMKYLELQDQRLSELAARVEQALGVAKQAAPVPLPGG